MPRALVALGSNLGPRQELLQRAIERLGREPGVRVGAQSRVHETRPAGGPAGQPLFLNSAAVLETSLEPGELLEVLLHIEAELGRERSERWAARPIDLDLLMYGERVVSTERLVLPHPRMAWRRFVLEPAAEIAAQWLHPPTGWSIARLLEHLNSTPRYVALAGPPGVGKTELARAIAFHTGAETLLGAVEPARLAAFCADPAGEAWPMGIEFLLERARRLDASAPLWRLAQRLAVSDFWFDQSIAFAQVWIAPERQGDFLARWAGARQGVVRPRLIVLLEAPDELLRDRIAARGRRCEEAISEDRLRQIGQALAAVAGRPDQGPVLRLPAGEPDRGLAEVLAAIEAMS